MENSERIWNSFNIFVTVIYGCKIAFPESDFLES